MSRIILNISAFTLIADVTYIITVTYVFCDYLIYRFLESFVECASKMQLHDGRDVRTLIVHRLRHFKQLSRDVRLSLVLRRLRIHMHRCAIETFKGGYPHLIIVFVLLFLRWMKSTRLNIHIISIYF